MGMGQDFVLGGAAVLALGILVRPRTPSRSFRARLALLLLAPLRVIEPIQPDSSWALFAGGWRGRSAEIRVRIFVLFIWAFVALWAGSLIELLATGKSWY